MHSTLDLGDRRCPWMRLPKAANTSRPWRIHELTADFRLEDVRALPTPGGPDDFTRLVQLMAAGDPSQGSSGAVRTLFAIRWKVGALFDWDGPDVGHGLKRPRSGTDCQRICASVHPARTSTRSASAVLRRMITSIATQHSKNGRAEHEAAE